MQDPQNSDYFTFDNFDDPDQQSIDLIDDEPYLVHVPDAECENDILKRCSDIKVPIEEE